MKALLYVVPLGLFCVLCSYSYGRCPPREAASYSKAQVLAVNDLLDDDWLSQIHRSELYKPAKHVKWSRL